MLILCAILLTAAAEANARGCSLPSGSSRIIQKDIPQWFFICLLKEIERLKKRQIKLERIISKHERLIGELPAPYLNNNGKVTAEPGRQIGSATFILDARLTGGISSLPVEHSILEQLCTTRQCRLSLVLRVVGFRKGETIESTLVGPCNFDYNATSGDWIRGTGCSGKAMSGRDGNGAVGITSGYGAEVIIEAGEACLLADANARKVVGAGHEFFERDHSMGLYLIAVTERRTDGVRRFKCDLKIE